MASGRRASAGDRVLEGRHVIGLFFLMILFSCLFFTLGYVMARNQFEGQVRAETVARPSDMVINSKTDVESKHAKDVPKIEPATDPATVPSPEWEFYRAGEPKPVDEHLKPAPAVANAPAKNTASAPAKNLNASAKPAAAAPSKGAASAPQSAHAQFNVQVAALTKQ